MAIADLLAPALNLATERWGRLPGLDLEPTGTKVDARDAHSESPC